jgi:hypothetical protein
VRKSDHRAVRAWPSALGDFRVQRTESVSQPLDWVMLAATPVCIEGFNTGSNAPAGPRGFFRLSRSGSP